MMKQSTINNKWGFSAEYTASSLKILDIALSQVAAYRSWRAFDPGTEFDVDTRFAALPALTKKNIRENFPLGMLPAGRDLDTGLAVGEIQFVETSGSTDDKVTNIWNQQWWDASECSSWKLNAEMNKIATGTHREAILVNPKNVGIKSDERDLSKQERRLERFLYLNEKTDPLAWSSALMDRMITELNNYQPAVLEVNPSYLARLCRYIYARGQNIFQPGAIVFTYEYATIFQKQQIQRIFENVPQISSYGTTETGYVFMQCEEGKFHQNSEFCRVDFEPFKAEHGGPLLGRILVTLLNNPWNYFVRFDTGDIVMLEETGKCVCGRKSGLILSTVAGRKVNLTVTCAGRLVTLLELDGLVSKLQGVEMYKLIQTAPGKYDLHLVSRRVDKEKLNKEAVSLLKDLYGREAQINVIQDNDIAPEGSGKYLVAQSQFPIDLEGYLEKSNKVN